MFINKDFNGVNDNELEEKKEKKSLFKRNKKVKKEQNENNGVDYNKTYVNDNNGGSDFVNVIRTIIIFGIAIAFVIIVVPKLFKYDNSHKQIYVDKVSEMVDKVVAYYDQPDNKCTTTTKDKYYFLVTKSDQIFGVDVKSPFLKNSLQGYVEFDVSDDGKYDIYVSFTDGLFGFERIEYSKLKASNVEVFPYLSIEHPSEMVCDKQFVFSE